MKSVELNPFHVCNCVAKNREISILYVHLVALAEHTHCYNSINATK